MNNYFFVDGSALLNDVQKARTALSIPPKSKLNLKEFAARFTGYDLQAFHVGGYRRFVFYFVKDDERLKEQVVLPDHTIPGQVLDVRIEICGKRIPQFERAKEWLEENNAPQEVRESLYKSEKAVDTQICCDALQLAATGKLDRLFLYTNDFDFVPLCRTLRQLGCNINLLRLRSERINESLVKECDAFHVLDDAVIRDIFVST